ncbi:MAG: sortase, partial [Oscillospiraceae bacterium]|nr:sortase [Candidatus Equicaccousia limihippi]
KILLSIIALALIVAIVWSVATYKKETPAPTPATPSEPEIVYYDNPIDFASLYEANNDVIGYIKVDGTVIDYPIYQAGLDKEDDFYLDHDAKKHKSVFGAIYIQRRNAKDFSDRNTVLYGHCMKNGSMFAAEHRFGNSKDFFEKNRNIMIYLPDRILTYTIYAVTITDDTHLLYKYDFNTPEGTSAFLDMLQKPSGKHFVYDKLEVSDQNNFVTLSTCTAREGERLLLVGVLTDLKHTKSAIPGF